MMKCEVYDGASYGKLLYRESDWIPSVSFGRSKLVCNILICYLRTELVWVMLSTLEPELLFLFFLI